MEPEIQKPFTYLNTQVEGGDFSIMKISQPNARTSCSSQIDGKSKPHIDIPHVEFNFNKNTFGAKHIYVLQHTLKISS